MFITRHWPLFLYSTGEEPGGAAPDQGATADTPEGTGIEQQPTTQDNWEERYKEAQAWGTRNAQRVRDLEAHEQLFNAWNSDDPDLQHWAAEKLGIQLEAAEEDTQQPSGELDPRTLARLEKLEQHIETTTTEQQEQAQYAAYREVTDPQLKEMGVPDGLHQVVADAALNLPGIETPQGPVPDLKGAYAQVEAMAEHFAGMPTVRNLVLENWRSTKRTAHVPSVGTEGTQTPDLDDPQQRRTWMGQEFAARSSDD